MESRHLIHITVITCIYFAFEKNIYVWKMGSCWQLCIIYALEERKIEIIKLHIEYILIFARDSGFFREKVVKEQRLKQLIHT